MKRVCLVGDSIRLGYEPAVRSGLADIAEIFASAENGQHTVNLLLNFYNWIQQKNPDLVHIAAGGWDVRNIVRGVPGNIVPLDHYRHNVGLLMALIKKYTRAKIIWATITPMDIAANFKSHEPTGHPARTEGDIEIYNAAAKQVALEHQVQVNDLYDLVSQRGKSQMLCPDGVHFTDTAYNTLGAHVSQIIRASLAG